MKLSSLLRWLPWAAAIAASPALASEFPSKPITIVVNGGPGSLPDLFARPLAEKLRDALGQPVIVDNKPGGGGMVAMQTVKSAAPDGHMLALVTNAHMVWNQFVFPKLSYNPETELQAVSPIAVIPMALVVNAALPVNTLEDLIALAKSKPGVLNYASSGNGSPPHVMFELLRDKAGLNIVHVPFKTGTDARTSVIGGDTQIYLAGTSLIEPMVKEGRLKLLAVSPKVASPVFDKAPTFQSRGYDGLESTVWLGVVTGAGVPVAVVERLNREIGAALADPGIRKSFDSHGTLVYHAPRTEFAERIKAERALWGPAIRKLGIRPD